MGGQLRRLPGGILLDLGAFREEGATSFPTLDPV